MGFNTCHDCGKYKLPIGKSMYDKNWRCIECNREYIKTKEAIDNGENSK